MSQGQDQSKSSERVCLGAVAGAFGVRGEVRLKPFTQDPQAIADYGPLQDEGCSCAYDIKLTRVLKGGFVAAWLQGVTTREQAEALKGVRLYASRQALPALAEEEYYYTDLIGLKAMNLQGDILGKVQAMHNHGAGDILELRPLGQGRSVLLPFTQVVVPQVDLQAGYIVVDPPEDLLPTDLEKETAPSSDTAEKTL